MQDVGSFHFTQVGCRTKWDVWSETDMFLTPSSTRKCDNRTQFLEKIFSILLLKLNLGGISNSISKLFKNLTRFNSVSREAFFKSLPRYDIQLRTKYLKRALPVKLRPPPSLKRARWSFFRPPKRTFYRIKLKLTLIMKMMISVMKIVLDLMIMVLKMTKKQTNIMTF